MTEEKIVSEFGEKWLYSLNHNSAALLMLEWNFKKIPTFYDVDQTRKALTSSSFLDSSTTNNELSSNQLNYIRSRFTVVIDMNKNHVLLENHTELSRKITAAESCGMIFFQALRDGKMNQEVDHSKLFDSLYELHCFNYKLL
jgi:hypothetical protein